MKNLINKFKKIIFSIILWVFVFIPEILMFFIWKWVDPVGFWENLVMILAFVFLGGSICGFLFYFGILMQITVIFNHNYKNRR